MRVSVIALNWSQESIIRPIVNRYSAQLYVVGTSGRGIKEVSKEAMDKSDVVIFVANTGIVVRTIAPYLQSKWKDPGVVVVDTQGVYVISLVGGHWGRANRVASEVSSLIGAIPVVTTRSELLGIVPFDIVSRENHLMIENPNTLKYIATHFSERKEMPLFTDLPVKRLPKDIPLFSLEKVDEAQFGVVISERKLSFLSRERFLFLRPKNVVCGVGYKKEEDPEHIRDMLHSAFSIFDISPFSVKSISTILQKKGDGIMEEVGRTLNVPIRYLDPRDLIWIDKIYPGSSWVRTHVGVGSVSLSTMIYQNRSVRILLESENFDGVMISLGKIRKVIDFGR